MSELSERTSHLLRTYINHNIAGYLQPGAPVPDEWTGSEEDWHVLVDTVRRMAEASLTREFVDAIAKGWRAHELIRGRLDDGRTLMMGTGQVVDISDSPSEGKMSGSAYAQFTRWRRAQDAFIASRQG